MEPWTSEWKEEQLRVLAEDWADCGECELCETRQNVVFGAGNPDADVMLVGEAAGEEEDATGLPFVGRSGNLLRALVSRSGFAWGDLYVTNIIGCHPPGNRDPRIGERDACMARLHSIVYIVDPLLVIPVGKFALQSMAKGRDWGIKDQAGVLFSSPAPHMKFTKDRNGLEISGHVFPRTGDDKKKRFLEYDLIPILHPSFLLRDDGYDEKTNKFPPGGFTERTLEHLTHIKGYVDSLKKEYGSIPEFGS